MLNHGDWIKVTARYEVFNGGRELTVIDKIKNVNIKDSCRKRNGLLE